MIVEPDKLATATSEIQPKPKRKKDPGNLCVIHRSNGKPIRRVGHKPGRNEKCPCGSGKKFGACHWNGGRWERVAPGEKPFQKPPVDPTRLNNGE